MADSRGDRHRAYGQWAQHLGGRVLVRYEVTDGRVTDVALDDATQAHIVVIVLASVATVGGLFLKPVAWGRD